MSDKILVTGATAPVGRELVRLLLEEGADVKAGVRRPDRSAQLFDPAVEVVELDYSQPATFDAAVEWADRIFLQPPAFDPDAHQTLMPLLDWAVQAGVDHVVTISAMGMEVRDDLPMRRVERHVESLGVEYTFLRPNFYMQSFGEGFLGDRIRRTGRFKMPVQDAKVSIVDGRDVAAVACRALTSSEHFGEAYTLTGPEALTHAEIAGIVGAAAGRDVEFESCSDEELLRWLIGAGWRPDVAGVVIALFQSVRGGVREDVTADIISVMGRSARSFEQFAEEHQESWAIRDES
ncbi:MAG: SDR family oxidoreductase [Gemmatimonadetes bacterium]|nr:SDR family oxidoreductase [Gemmatimonadota bacterium]MDA1102763.1 SDR family oxidoreductase [Gemmatimonadota bacterium]